MRASVLKQALAALRQGKIIAYPTEGLYGLGCDPFNQSAVLRLLDIKQRSVKKGLILLAATWDQVAHLVEPIPDGLLKQVLGSWPGPITWVFPAKTQVVPKWISGAHTSLAIRLSAHPVARDITRAFEKPIVSTSANLQGQTPAKTPEAVLKAFQHDVAFICPGKLGDLKGPTPIKEVKTGKQIR